MPGGYISAVETKQRECWKVYPRLTRDFDSRVHGQPSMVDWSRDDVAGESVERRVQSKSWKVVKVSSVMVDKPGRGRSLRIPTDTTCSPGLS